MKYSYRSMNKIECVVKGKNVRIIIPYLCKEPNFSLDKI